MSIANVRRIQEPTLTTGSKIIRGHRQPSHFIQKGRKHQSLADPYVRRTILSNNKYGPTTSAPIRPTNKK